MYMMDPYTSVDKKRNTQLILLSHGNSPIPHDDSNDSNKNSDTNNTFDDKNQNYQTQKTNITLRHRSAKASFHCSSGVGD